MFSHKKTFSSFFFFFLVIVSSAKGEGGGKKKTKRAGGASRKKSAASGPRCIKCEAVMKEGMRFCNKCGAPQDKPAEESVVEEETDEVIIVEEIVEEEEEEEDKKKTAPAIAPVPKQQDDAVFKAPAPVQRKPAPLMESTEKPSWTSHNKLVQLVDEDGDEEEEDSANTPTNPRLSKKNIRVNDKIENSPKRAVEIESSEEDEPPSAVKTKESVAEPKVVERKTNGI